MDSTTQVTPPLLDNRLLVVDIETTGFSQAKDFILELGIVSLNLDDGSIEHLFDETFSHPSMTAKHRSAWIFGNSDLTVAEVRESETLKYYFDEIQAIFHDYAGRITAWNRDFDVRFLEYHGFRLGPSIPCPMKESTSYFKLEKAKGNGYKWPKAQEAWDFLFPLTPRVEAHRGLDDADYEAHIIHSLYKKGIYCP